MPQLKQLSVTPWTQSVIDNTPDWSKSSKNLQLCPGKHLKTPLEQCPYSSMFLRLGSSRYSERVNFRAEWRMFPSDRRAGAIAPTSRGHLCAAPGRAFSAHRWLREDWSRRRSRVVS